MTRAGIDFGPLDHLPPEDAELYRQLYLERNTVSRGEAQKVANTARAARPIDWDAWEKGGPSPVESTGCG